MILKEYLQLHSGRYFGRGRVNGKLIRRSLEMHGLSHLRLNACFCPPANVCRLSTQDFAPAKSLIEPQPEEPEGSTRPERQLHAIAASRHLRRFQDIDPFASRVGGHL
jgi:hypothetical protein